MCYLKPFALTLSKQYVSKNFPPGKLLKHQEVMCLQLSSPGSESVLVPVPPSSLLHGTVSHGLILFPIPFSCQLLQVWSAFLMSEAEWRPGLRRQSPEGSHCCLPFLILSQEHWSTARGTSLSPGSRKCDIMKEQTLTVPSSWCLLNFCSWTCLLLEYLVPQLITYCSHTVIAVNPSEKSLEIKKPWVSSCLPDVGDHRQRVRHAF